MAMALDKKTINQNYICQKCNQPLTIGEYTISNWNDETHPDSTIYDIIKNSDNIGMSHIIRTLGLKNFLDYYQKLGLNSKTGIDLQGEARPLVKQYWPEIDFATASFGQGIAITQIQMLTAFNSLANDGIYVQPRVVNSLEENGKLINTKARKNYQVFDTDTTDLIKDVLKFGVENGTVAKFKPDNLEVCAKSGTAQVAVKGEYAQDQTIASYIGFSPCQNPLFTMLVTIDTPRTSPWGASTAAPTWYQLASKISLLLGI
jgi:cell division protein FtsI/penicillin-binding protein 2